MHQYQGAGRAATAIATMGGTAGGNNLAVPATLAMRLEQANNLIFNQCRRIETALGRVEGAPQLERSNR